ncbi:MAG: PocR ligand-binding domain-containing protein [Christensenellaceae bacterium]|jgi:ligand-binding sensor protein/AraC-like DNA-binding protein
MISHHLTRILDMKKWQQLQDSLALVTGLAIITIDYKGTPLTKHSSRRPFCEHIRNHPDLHKLCQKCDARGGLEAVRISQPYVYVCHCDIVDIAIPIIMDNQYIGAIMAGEVRLLDSDGGDQLEKIIHASSKQHIQAPEIIRLYDSIPFISYERLRITVQMLFDLCNYIVEEAMNKNIVLEMYEKISASNDFLLDSTKVSSDSVQKIRRELSSALTSAYIKTSSQAAVQCANKILQPVFDYLYEHRNMMLSQKDAAALCHISAGHFSRLFTKETGENYSVFCARQKVEWAKKLLEKTDLSVSQISDELGFNEPSYFIKIFRNYEGTTPSYYRKHSEIAGGI